MLSVVYKHIMLTVVMLNVIMLSVILLSVVAPHEQAGLLNIKVRLWADLDFRFQGLNSH
jgi:hypothetical protein